MKERPILFSAPMVRAILDGSKTQTRRIVKPQPVGNHRGKFKFDTFRDDEGIEEYWQNYPLWGPVRCPYGHEGDQLWVRETFAYVGRGLDPGYLTYRATYPRCLPPGLENVPDDIHEAGEHWTPSIHMPRKASRIQLEITGVRVERLQDCSEEDAKAEGVLPNWCGPLDKGPNGEGSEGWLGDEWINYMVGEDGPPAYSAKESYQSLWESINGPGSWEANPWVWVVEFKRVKP